MSAGFEWDEAKRIINLQKHGLDFEDLARLFDGPLFERRVMRGPEERWLATGRFGTRWVTIIYTGRNSRRRIISARTARDNERLAIVTYTAEEARNLVGKTDWAKIDARTPEEVERLADEDELDEGYGIAADYIFHADGTLTETASGVTFTRAALLDELTARRARAAARAEAAE